MEGNKVTLKIKHMTDTVHEVEIDPNQSVLELKKLLEQKTSIPTGEQKLIFKGK